MDSTIQELEKKIPRIGENWPTWLVIIVTLVLSGGTFLLDLMHPAYITPVVPYLGAVLVASLSGRRTVTFGITVLCSVLLVIGFQQAEQGEPSLSSQIALVQCVTVICLLGIFLLHRIYVVRQRNEAMRELSDALQRLKVLHGMLPICSSCKKIKSDKGEWRQLEGYIQEHSEAEFTHGLCNDCADLMYSQFLASEEAKANDRAKAAPSVDAGGSAAKETKSAS